MNESIGWGLSGTSTGEHMSPAIRSQPGNEVQVRP